MSDFDTRMLIALGIITMVNLALAFALVVTVLR